MSKYKNKQFLHLMFFILLFISPVFVQAVEVDKIVTNDWGTNLKLIASVDSRYVKEPFTLNLTVEALYREIKYQHDVRVKIRFSNHSEADKTVSMGDIPQGVREISKSPQVQYDLEWKSVRLELKLLWVENKITDSREFFTEWMSFFSLLPGTFINQYFWVLIIIGVAAIASGFLGFKYFTKWKK